jgi:hypothetical protein
MSSAHAPTPRAIRIARPHGVERHGVADLDSTGAATDGKVGVVADFMAMPPYSHFVSEAKFERLSFLAQRPIPFSPQHQG